MKITTKKPLRPRGRNSEKRQETKGSIAEVYAHGPVKPVQIIPATKETEEGATKKKLRVCAYCRVSTEEDNQASSYELQVQNYTKMIKENDAWEFAGIFADEGISGTSMQHREQFLAMIELCKAGQIDLIITKQISRFARNVLDSLNTIFMLRKLDPPVGVFFETEHLNTLDRSSDMVVTVFRRYIVYDLLPADIAEIHVEIRHTDSFRIQKALKEKIVSQRIDRRYAESVSANAAYAGASSGTNRYSL